MMMMMTYEEVWKT